MRSALNVNTVFATVAMARQGSSSLILVVEGDDDHFIVKDHVNGHDVLLIAGEGRPLVLGAAVEADRHALRGIRFMIDVDYDPFVNPTVMYPPNVITSIHHDVVMDIVHVSTSLMDRVIDSHSRAARRRAENPATFDTPLAREDALLLAAFVAPLRIVNDRKVLELNLKDFPFGELPAKSPTNADVAELAIRRSKTEMSTYELEAEISAETSHLLSGTAFLVGDHDFFRALARVLKFRGVNAGADSMWTAFLAGLTCSNLSATSWYQELDAWGAANSRSTFACPCAA